VSRATSDDWMAAILLSASFSQLDSSMVFWYQSSAVLSKHELLDRAILK
jgi:hypothetical protein